MAVDAARAKSLFLAASDLADPAERAAYLDRECGDDAELRGRVEALLRANDAAPLPPARAGDATSAHASDRRPETEDYGDPTARVGSALAGKYKLIEEIGEGGMGSVYMAQQTEPMKRAVAVKVIKAGMDSKAVLVRFEAERQVLAMLDHPNIAKVLDAGTTDGGRPFFVMELVKGVPITEYCDQRRLTPRQRLELFVPVCQAIQHAHQKGIIHRDIKPSNVLVAMYDDRPVPKVIDFGVAKAAGQTLTDKTLMTGFGAVVGTPEYMSPEQANLNNLDIDTRSDVYSLGVLLYELLTGTTPVDRRSFGKAALLEILRIVREVEAPRPSAKLSTIDTLPSVAANRGTEPAKLSKLMKGELDWLVLKALEKDRTRRYESANALSRDIQRYLADEVVEARPPSTGYRFRKVVRRHKGPAIAAAAVVLALVAGVAAVVTVQGSANRDLAAKNAELANEQAKVEARNKELADEQAKVQARFELAQKAIAIFHTGVSEDILLKNEQFQEVRTKLLKEAARFYSDLEKLLASQTDAKSRRLLANGYFQLGDLTEKIGDKKEALSIQRKALAVRRELAAQPGADVETRLDVARSLRVVGRLVGTAGDPVGALRAWEEMRDIAAGLEAESPTATVRSVLAQSYHNIAIALSASSKLQEALAAYKKAVEIRQTLRNAEPTDPEITSDLAYSLNNLGGVLRQMGNPDDAMVAFEQARELWQQMVEANPAGTQFQNALAASYLNIGVMLHQAGKIDKALESYGRARDISQKAVDANPAVTLLQEDLAKCHLNIGILLFVGKGKVEESLEELQKSQDIAQKLVNDNPTVAQFQTLLAGSHFSSGVVLGKTGKPNDALASFKKAKTIWQRLCDMHATVTQHGSDLANCHHAIGELLSQMGMQGDSLAAYEEAVAVLQKLASANPTVNEFRSRLAYSHINVGRSRARQKQFPEAFTALDAGLAIHQKLVDANPKNTSYSQGLGYCHAIRGGARIRAGQPGEAAADLRRALELWAKVPHLNIEMQAERSRALALLAGLGEDAKSGVTPAGAKTFADQSVAALADVVKLGRSLPSELKEPDFDALRGRPDFQKLVAEVEAKAEKPPAVAPMPGEKK